LTTRAYQHALFIRDRWQATDNLTLTLGLRWEYYPTLSRANRPYEVVQWDKVISGTGPMILDLGGGADVATSKKLFGPRVGFAYRLSDKDVLRMGYGLAIIRTRFQGLSGEASH
jgi:outer membrane receptor protein involved in Fe transport